MASAVNLQNNTQTDKNTMFVTKICYFYDVFVELKSPAHFYKVLLLCFAEERKSGLKGHEGE